VKIKWLRLLLAVLVAGFLIPESHRIPVAGASVADWHPKSFWYYPWGRSGVHKGIDIFAREGVPVLAASSGMVVYTGVDSLGGNIVLILGAKWRFYYYAHLQRVDAQGYRFVHAGEPIGAVGSTGNAKGKPPHLHFAIRNLFPSPWLYNSRRPQAWNTMFYLDPTKFLTGKDNQ
jgi:peptidoglycan LD-endopeptidase LytH